jgi:hypothetical protein
MITSPSASSDAVTLYETDAGSVTESEDGLLTVRLDGFSFSLEREALASLQQTATSLAGDVRRCGSDCRWQLRLPGAGRGTVVVLSSDEVLAIEDLISGADAMLELDEMLSDLGIEV